jgi:TPR repeat protein
MWFLALSAILFFSASATAADLAQNAGQVVAQAQAGSPASQYQLGLMLLNGQGVKADHKKAAYWLQRSADQGNDAAEFVLAKLLYTDSSVQGGKTAAYLWAVRAATNGNKERIALRDQIEGEISPELVPVLQKKALAWKPKLEELQVQLPPSKKTQ